MFDEYVSIVCCVNPLHLQSLQKIDSVFSINVPRMYDGVKMYIPIGVQIGFIMAEFWKTRKAGGWWGKMLRPGFEPELLVQARSREHVTPCNHL